MFADALARCAATEPALPADRRGDLIDLADRLRAPLTVAVRGRPGVGRRTVARALTCAGVTTVDRGAELVVRVLAEVPKPEDLAALAGPDRPGLLILNKADLTGFRPGGPVAAAARYCVRLAASTGVPAEPMVALAAVAADGLADGPEDPDGGALAALRVLVTAPADLSSPDAFLAGAHPLSARVRAGLLERLDLFGIAHAVVALRADPAAGGAEVCAALRRAGRIEPVIAALARAGATPMYRRVAAATARLRELACGDPDAEDAVAGFLAGDDAVAARAAAAAAVLASAGLTVESGAADPEGPGRPEPGLRAALRWRRYRDGPLDALHRDCAGDLVRAALRPAPAGPTRCGPTR